MTQPIRHRNSTIVDEPVYSHCLWCGKLVHDDKYIVNPGGKPILRCCSQDCSTQTAMFIERDKKYQIIFLMIMAVLATLSWIAVVAELQVAWAPLPFLGMCMCLLVWPRILPRYEYYQRLGIPKTQRYIRLIIGCLTLLALYMTYIQLFI